jgi:hypothetical protein
VEDICVPEELAQAPPTRTAMAIEQIESARTGYLISAKVLRDSRANKEFALSSPAGRSTT